MNSLLICGNSSKAMSLNESESTSDKYILQGLFAGPFGVENRNKRVYEADEYLKHLQYLRDDIKKGEPLLGELDHPDDRFEVKLKEASHRILDIWYDKNTNTIQGKIELLNTPNGKLAQSLVDQGIPLHISSRAAGSVNNDKTVSIQQIYTFDLVCKPGFAGAVLHRVNESETTDKYTDDVYRFLTESEKMESLNVAPQFGMLNEDVNIREIPSDVTLREEAKDIIENNNADNMDENKNVTNISEKDEKENVEEVEKEEKDTETEDNKDADNQEDAEDKGIDIISVKAEVDKDGDVEIVNVDSEEEKSEEDDDNKDKEDDAESEEDSEEKSDDEKSEDEDHKDESCDSEQPKHDPEKEMLLDCSNIKDREKKFTDKLDELIFAIKSKSEERKSNESATISKYPMSRLLNESNFAGFMSLNESQKNKVMSYLNDNGIVDIESVNENWKNGINYQPETEVWLKYAPKNYRELYESADENVKSSIKSTASFMLFENQHDVNVFWENTGLMDKAGNDMLNEAFINAMPKIAPEQETTELPYGQDFINAVTNMAKAYNS